MKDESVAKGIQFGCGALLGLVIGLFLFLRVLVRTDWEAAWVVIPILAVVFGLASMLRGDDLWGGFFNGD